MFVMNHRAVRMQFALPKIKMQFVNVRLAIEVIRSQKLVASKPMHVDNVLNRRFVNSLQPVPYANVPKVTRAIQKRLAASQSVNATAMPIARTALDACKVDVSTNVMIYAVQI